MTRFDIFHNLFLFFFSKKNPVHNEATYSMLNSMETVLVDK